MKPEEHVDWGTLVGKPWTSRYEDKKRGPVSVFVPLAALAFLAFVALGISIIHSRSAILGSLVIILGAILMFGTWYWVDRSISRRTGRYGGWLVDTRSFLIGVATLVVGLVVFVDPEHLVSENTHPYSTLLRALGLVVGLYGLMRCAFSLRG